MKTYQSYKPSGVEWIGEIPFGWRKSKIKYHFKLLSGFPFKSEEIINEEREFPIIRIGNVTSGKTDVYFDGELLDKFPKVEKGEYIVSLTGDFSIRKWENQTSLLNQRCGLIINNTLDDVRYLFYFLPFQFRILEKTKYFTTLKNLSNGELLDLDFILPPLSEQQQILSFLDSKTSQINELIQNKERKIELLIEKRNSLISEVITKGLEPNVKMKDSGVEWIGEIPEHWKMKKLKYIFQIRKRISGELGYDVLSITQKGVKIKDIESGKGQVSMDYTKYQMVEVGDFTMNHMDLLTGFIDISPYKGVTSPDYRVFSRTDEQSNSKYYLSLFQFGYTNKVFYGFGQGSSMFGRWRLPSIEFNNFKLPYPSLDEQNKIVDFLEKHTNEIDEMIQLEQKKIELLKEYRQSLISEVITGKIKVVE